MAEETSQIIQNAFGVSETVDVQNAIVAIIKANQAAISDGSYRVSDIIYLMPIADRANDAVDGFDQVDDELLDLVDAESVELAVSTREMARSAQLSPLLVAYVYQAAKIIFSSCVIASLAKATKAAKAA